MADTFKILLTSANLLVPGIMCAVSKIESWRTWIRNGGELETTWALEAHIKVRPLCPADGRLTSHARADPDHHEQEHEIRNGKRMDI